jgi:MarR family transcriptional regulator, organic hydroperoxide resistance regulator
MAVRTGTEFTSAWEEFTRAIRRARGRASGPLEGSGLTLAQFQLLEGLRSAGELTVSELAVGAGVAVPTATRMLDGLVRDGIVTRRQAEHDRRAVVISLTADGAAAVKVAAERVEAARARVRDSLTPGEQEQAAALLRRLAAAVEERL